MTCSLLGERIYIYMIMKIQTSDFTSYYIYHRNFFLISSIEFIVIKTGNTVWFMMLLYLNLRRAINSAGDNGGLYVYFYDLKQNMQKSLF